MMDLSPYELVPSSEGRLVQVLGYYPCLKLLVDQISAFRFASESVKLKPCLHVLRQRTMDSIESPRTLDVLVSLCKEYCCNLNVGGLQHTAITTDEVCGCDPLLFMWYILSECYGLL